MKTQALPAVLDAERQYVSQLRSFPSLTQEQEQALLDRALAGEKVSGDIVLSLQQRIYSLAYRMAARHLQGKEQAIERMDFVQEANRAMLRHFQLALTKENPYSYLLKAARTAMIDCIRKIEASQRDQDEVSSFSECIPTEIHTESSRKNEATYTPLYQAVQMLPEKQRLVILRHYGFGCAPEPLNTISRSISLKACASTRNNANYHHKRALTSLQQALGSAFPLLSHAGGVQ